MKRHFAKLTRRLKRPSGFTTLFLILYLVSGLFSQNNWTVSTSLTFNSGDYIYQQRTDNYYLNAGLRYSGSRWSVSASLPFILQKSAVYQQSTSVLPSNGHGMSNAVTASALDHYETGIGDLYLYGEYRMFKLPQLGLSLGMNAQLKAPTTNRLTLFSTGKLDYGLGLVLRQWFRTFSAFAEVSYVNIGDPEEITYLNPLGYGVGVGKFLANGKYSASLYFKGYTEIIQGIEPPRQLALGFFTMLSAKTFWSFYLIKGLSESSPNFGLSSGLDWKW